MAKSRHRAGGAKAGGRGAHHAHPSDDGHSATHRARRDALPTWNIVLLAAVAVIVGGALVTWVVSLFR